VALWSLLRLGALEPALPGKALAAEEPRLRAAAIAVARESPDCRQSLGPELLRLAADPDPRVRLQAALAVGDLDRPVEEIAGALVRVLDHGGVADPWLRLAALSSLHGREAAFIERLARSEIAAGDPAPAGDILREAARLLGAAGDRDPGVERALAAAGALRDRHAGLAFSLAAGLAAGLERAGTPPRRLGEESAARVTWTALFAAAAVSTRPPLPGEQGPSAAERAIAAGLLSHAPFALGAQALEALLDPANDVDLQLAAARAISGLEGEGVAALLLGAWPRATPRIREACFDGLLRGPTRLAGLAAAIGVGEVRWRDVDLARREALRRALGPEGSARLDAALAGQAAARSERDRGALIARYIKEAPARGDPARGLKAFDEHCASCHRLHGRGAAVGPDIAGTAKKPGAELIAEILDPGRSVVPGYTAYTIILDSGEALTGVLAGETASAVSLRRAGGAVEDIPRSAIRELAAGSTLMPEGLEARLTPVDVADLIEYLRSGPAAGNP
jgi:putative heme-binding domain-containing protein